MELEFFKLRVCGNDLILVSFLAAGSPEPAVLAPLARRLCDRIRGVGGSGVVFIMSRNDSRFQVRHYLPDGKETDLFPDALICASRYLFDSGHIDPETARFIESGVTRDVKVVDSNHFTVKLGSPFHFDGSVVREDNAREHTRNVTVDGRTLVTTPVMLLRPVSVVVLSEEGLGNLKALSRRITGSAPASVPVQPVFTRVYDRDDIRIFIHFDRREKDYITCAGAAAVASIVHGFCDGQILVRTGRNDLYAQWNEKKDEVAVTASADYSFSGFFYYESRAPKQ